MGWERDKVRMDQEEDGSEYRPVDLKAAAIEHVRQQGGIGPKLADAMEKTRWKSIKEAPKDGRWVLGWFPELGEVRQMRWGDANGWFAEHWNAFGRFTPEDPTMWMELPGGPET